MKTRISPSKLLLIVLISFVLASVVNIYPLSLQSSILRPMGLMMVLSFWLIFRPKLIGIVTAFVIGIIADLLLDTRLGQQAFSAVVMAFSIRVMAQYFRQLHLSSAWMIASAGLIVFQVVLWFVQFLTQNIFFAQAVYSLLMSIVTWPLVYIALIKFSKR